MIRLVALLAALCPVAVHAGSDTAIRVAVFDTELRRDGPGLLLRDITSGKDAQVNAVIEVIATAGPDVLAVLSFDWDYQRRALAAFVARLAEHGAEYPYVYSARPNSGLASGLDLDGDGLRGGPGDAQGYGDFTGQNGLAVLSRLPILTGQVQDFSGLLWRDLPGALLPRHPDGSPFPSPQAQEAQRLSSTAHWAVPIGLPDGEVMTLLAFHATPPVFDGPEDRNGRRNHDEILFWRYYLDGRFGAAPAGRLVLAGGANLDPVDSDGRRDAIRALLGDPRLADPHPEGAEGTDTVDWSDVGAGKLRVDYVLPSPDWRVLGAGVLWPEEGAEMAETVRIASRHRLVWVDLALK